MTKRTVLKLLHTSFALEQEVEIECLRAAWLAANERKHPERIMQPVLGRWSCVGECVVKLLEIF